MAYTSPTIRTTGDLITASIWNTDIVDNILFLASHEHDGSAGGGAFYTMLAYKKGTSTFDDFLWGSADSGGLGNLRWAVANDAGATSSIRNSEADHPGIYQPASGTTIGNGSRCSFASFTAFLLAEDFDIYFLIRLNTNDANTAVRFGLAATLANQPANGIYLEKATAGTNWVGIARTSSVDTPSTNVAATSTAWTVLRLRRVGSTIAFSVNGGTEQIVSTGIPTGAMSPFFSIVTSAAASKTVDVDYYRGDVVNMSRS